MPIANASPIFERLGKTYSSFSQTERKQDVQEALAAINYQMEQNRRRYQAKIQQLEQISKLGNYVVDNVAKQVGMNRVANDLNVTDKKAFSMWDWLKSAVLGPDPNRSYGKANGQDITGRGLGMISAGQRINPLVGQQAKEAVIGFGGTAGTFSPAYSSAPVPSVSTSGFGSFESIDPNMFNQK